MAEEHQVATAKEDAEGRVIRMTCTCGWNVTIRNDPRYDSDIIEAINSHRIAATVGYWETMLAEAKALPEGPLKEDVVNRYQTDLNRAQNEFNYGWLTGRPSYATPFSERST